MNLKLLVVYLIFLNSVIYAQTNVQPSRAELSGPRFGFTIITGDLAKTMKDDHDLNPFITQFGWQSETRFFSVPDGPIGIAESIFLIGGLEQGVFLPSLSLVVGLRGANGAEIGIGPNISISGAAYVIGGGITKSIGQLNIPVNLSVVLSGEGPRISLLIGFNTAISP